MSDPTDPVTVAYYDTYLGPAGAYPGAYEMFQGAFGIDVRNADGLIVVSDMTTGLWTFKMEGFDGWKGSDWGVPNVTSAQEWDR